MGSQGPAAGIFLAWLSKLTKPLLQRLKSAQGILGQYIYHHTKYRAHDSSQGVSHWPPWLTAGTHSFGTRSACLGGSVVGDVAVAGADADVGAVLVSVVSARACLG